MDDNPNVCRTGDNRHAMTDAEVQHAFDDDDAYYRGGLTPEEHAAATTLQLIDRVCARVVMGDVSATDAVAQITALVGKWTDPS